MTDFKPMLAKDGDLSKVKFPLAVQVKLDGIRAAVVNGKLVSRTLKPIPNAAIREALERPEFEGFDGELLVGDPAASNAYRRTTSFVMAPNKTGEPWAFHVFDLWNHPGNQLARLNALSIRARDARWFNGGEDIIKWVDTKIVNTLAELEEVEAGALAAGHEGVIVRVPDAPYKFGRSGKTGPLLKVKRYIDFEAEVIGVYEEMHNANEAKTNALGRTERSSHAAGKIGKGTLGGLVLRAINGPAAGVEFRCGTGFDAAARSGLWGEWHDARANFKGAVAKVKSFPIGVKDKPRHPVFLGWRDMEVDG